MKDYLKSVITRIAGQCGKESMPSRSPMSALSRALLLCLLVSTKAFKRKCHASFIYTEVGYESRALAKVGSCCAVWHFVAK